MALRRSQLFAAFDTELNAELQRWFDATRAAKPETYAEAEQVFRDFPTTPPGGEGE